MTIFFPFDPLPFETSWHHNPDFQLVPSIFVLTFLKDLAKILTV